MAFGLLNIDKPSGMTSQDVVSIVRRETRIKKIGHAGTLDPLATGVLVLCVGAATRLSEYVMGQNKVYRAGIRLGQTTDTYDADGEIIAENETSITRDQFEDTLQGFLGNIEQVPPMYSAIKVGGEKLYEKARRGEVIERKPRPVTIYRLNIEAFDFPNATVTVHCTKGTYIRSLAHDIGEALGVGAHLTQLRRMANGENFTVEHAVTLEDFRAAVEDGTWQDHLLDVSLALSHMPRIELNNQPEKLVRNGGFVKLGINNGGPVQAWTDEGIFIGILVPHGEDNGETIWKPEKIFNL